MTKKIDEPKAEAVKTWYLPTLSVTVEAETYEEAVKLAEAAKKEEEGDVNA